MASTFKILSERADFSKTNLGSSKVTEEIIGDRPDLTQDDVVVDRERAGRLGTNGLVYNINIHLPESRDPAVYDALFRSLRRHLL
jgi:hypothetical protein